MGRFVWYHPVTVTSSQYLYVFSQLISQWINQFANDVINFLDN
jgi:hypothetical protein